MMNRLRIVGDLKEKLTSVPKEIGLDTLQEGLNDIEGFIILVNNSSYIRY